RIRGRETWQRRRPVRMQSGKFRRYHGALSGRRFWPRVAVREGLPQRSHLEVEYCSGIGAAIFAKVTGGKGFDRGADKLSTTKELVSCLREVEHGILQVEVELKKLGERPQEAHAPSPAVISVRLWREDQFEEDS